MVSKDKHESPSHLRNDPQCPGCDRTMRLVGRENQTESNTELLTFECSDCGHHSTTTTNQ
jgi:hypothetical protein